MRVELLSPRLLVMTLGGDTLATSVGANCAAVAGDRSCLVVDPLIAPAHAEQVMRVLEQHRFPPVRYAVLTHHHTDHALGASWFAARGASVIAQRRCAELMTVQHPGLVDARRADPDLSSLFADAEPRAPDLIFDDHLAIDLGGRQVFVRHLGHGHTPGDGILLIPDEKTVVCGDLVSVGYHFNYEEAEDTAELLRGLARLGQLAAEGYERFVPGHGPAGGIEIVTAQAEYHSAVQQAIEADARGAAAALRTRFPGYLLESAIGSRLTDPD